MEEKKKKKLKTWQIVLIVFGGLILLGIIFGNSSSNNNSSNSLTGNNSPQNPSSGSVSTNEKIKILNYNSEIDSFSFKIIGSAENVAGKELNYCEIDAKFYDKDGAVIGNSLDNINNLGKDETWKFSIYYLGTASDVDHYKIEVGSCW